MNLFNKLTKYCSHLAFALNEQTIDKFQILFKIERVQFYIIQQNWKLGLSTANENI